MAAYAIQYVVRFAFLYGNSRAGVCFMDCFLGGGLLTCVQICGLIFIEMLQPGARDKMLPWFLARGSNVRSSEPVSATGDGSYSLAYVLHVKSASSTWHRENQLYNPVFGSDFISGATGVMTLLKSKIAHRVCFVLFTAIRDRSTSFRRVVSPLRWILTSSMRSCAVWT